MAAIKQHGYALEFVSDSFKKNKTVVTTAVKKSGYVLLDAYWGRP